MNQREETDKRSMLFMQLVLTFQAAAWQHLGKLPHPSTGKPQRDLDQAKNAIDTLDMLRHKCKGNLSDEEEHFLNHIVSELMLNYVDECSRPPESTGEKPPPEDNKKGSDEG